MSGEGFLSRWSRRKRGEEVAEPAPPEAPAPLAEAAPTPLAGHEEVPPDLPPPDLPSIEALTAASDVTAFLRPGVPGWLRQAALRRIWSLDPFIRDFTGPADYAWDFNAPDGVPGFALELGGDVEKLLAQAIGQVVEEKDAAPAGEPEAPPALLAEASPAVRPAPVETAEALPAVAEPLAPATPLEAPAAPARRRHGGALPS